jgi:ketosteroid isomerase-like protein
MAVDALQLPDGGLAVNGREEIYQLLLAQTKGTDFSLTWEPLDAMVARSGELGFTWGIYYYESVDELGAPYVAEGKYVYIWRHNAGRWELALDITNQTEPDYQDYEEWLEEESSEEELGEAEPESAAQDSE